MAQKARIRREVLARRQAAAAAPAPVGAGEVRRPDPATHVLPLLTGCRFVASYLALPGEPATAALHAAARALGSRVGVPRLRDDGGLDLVELTPGGPLDAGPRGTVSPRGADLGWVAADLVIAPALAVDRRGVRLGRGGGSYDRALSLVRPGTPVVALVSAADDVYDELPREPHDVPVTAAASPAGLLWFS